MERKLILRTVCLLAVCLSRSLASDFRNESVEMGTTVTLRCINSKIVWQEMIYVIWKINLQGKNCSLGVADNDTDHDTCKDGKKLNRSADGAYHLIIPNISVQDEGNYTCDVSYRSGGSVETIGVSAWARPHLSGWLESEHGRTVAVCAATSKPEASIRWEPQWNSSSPIAQTPAKTTEGLFRVMSRLHLPQHTSHRNLTCVATHNDLKHTETQFSNFTFKDTHVIWPYILVGVCATCSIIVLLTGFFITRKKLLELSMFRNTCCKPNISTSIEEKPPQPCDPEELQPYASYVQRVNSIYNSSAELFNA